MFKNKNFNYDHIAAIIPSYTATGDITRIITTNGEQQTHHTRIKTVINNLARSRSIDLVALKQKVAHATEHVLLQPLPLAPGLVLCPFKTRIPRVAGDNSIGYINFHTITSVTVNHHKPYQSTLTLIGGTELPVLWTPSTVKKHLQFARLAISYTAQDSGICPELMLIAQKQVGVMYDLLMFQAQLARSSPQHDIKTLLP